jgi:hypothetical protein
MIHDIRPATIEDTYVLADNLQADDLNELLGWGHNPYKVLPESFSQLDDPISFFIKDKLCGMAGVSRTDAHSGAIWMLTTDHVRPYPKLFFKEAKKWVDQQTSYDILHNIADPRNRMHMKLLHMLGFKKLSYVPVGPLKLTYVEFAKLTNV